VGLLLRGDDSPHPATTKSLRPDHSPATSPRSLQPDHSPAISGMPNRHRLAQVDTVTVVDCSLDHVLDLCLAHLQAGRREEGAASPGRPVTCSNRKRVLRVVLIVEVRKRDRKENRT